MAAIKALQQWCRLQCDGYRGVAVTNMTTSFRDGLAFCALIHKYRPDLIDYESLSKEDVFNNNNLAFRVAEEQLGIPALLDAEDMVALRIPDRLSILTYVSQYYNYFHGRSPIGGVGGVKRPAEGSKEEPSEKKNLPVVAKTFVSEKAIENHPPPTLTVKTSPKLSRAAEQVRGIQKTVLTESSNKTGTLNSKCVMCKSHVHLVQRHFVDGKLYHRSCFKCSECSNLLLAGAYKAGKEPGSFICNTHQSSQNGCKPPSSGVATRPASAVVGPKSDSRTQSVTSHSSVLSTPVTVVLKPVDSTPVPQPWTTSAQKTQAARQRFFQSAPPAPEGPASSRKFSDISGQKKVPLSPEEEKNRARAVISKKLAEENCNNNNTRQFVIRSSERRFGDAPSSADIPSWRRAKCGPGTAGKQAAQPSTTPTSNKESPWLKAINKESTRPTTVSSNTKEPDRTEAPVDWRSNLKPVKKGPGLKTPASAENPSIILEEPKPDVSSKSSPITISSPSPRTPQSPISPPPSGPTSCRAPSPQEPHQDSAGTKNRHRSTAIIYPSPSSIGSPPLVPVWHRPLSPKPCRRSEGWGSKNGSCFPSSSHWPVVDSISFPPTGPASHKSPSPQQPRQSSKGSKNGKYLSPTNASRSEMRSPVSKSYHIPMDQIVKELHEIEDSLSNLERKGVEMEKKLRSCEEEGEGDILMDPLMVDWFNLIRKKQMYIRRESELVYIAKTLDLEEQQPGVEGELRRLLEKPDHLKSTEERRREEKLMDKLVEIVNGRNAIVEGLDEDRLREEEEDQQLDEMMQNLGIKKSKNKRKTSFSKLFRRKSKKLAVE